MERFFLELDPPIDAMRDWPHVVVVGGGFAGLKACQALAGQPVRVTLIDKRNFNLFQPLLYQVASGLVSEADVASPLRQMVGQAPNIQILLGEVVDIDPEAREVVFNNQRYGYHHLLLATGSGSTYFGREEWRPMAPPMKILEHADEIRRRLLMALEEAEQTPDPVRRSFLQTVVVVGAGPAGCELAGSLIELMHRAVQREFKQLPQKLCKVILVDVVDRVLPTMAPELSAAAGRYLEGAGVDLKLGAKVEDISPGRVSLRSLAGLEVLEAATICWTAGVRASRLGKLLGRPHELPRGSGRQADRGTRFFPAGLSRDPSRGRSVRLQPHRRRQDPAWHGRAGGADGGLGGQGHPGGAEGRRIPSLPLDGSGQHGGDRPLVRGGRSAGLARHGPDGVGALGLSPPGLHPRHRKPHCPLQQMDVANCHPPAHGPADHGPTGSTHRRGCGPVPGAIGGTGTGRTPCSPPLRPEPCDKALTGGKNPWRRQ